MENSDKPDGYNKMLKAIANANNVEYTDWDSIVLHLAHGEKSLVKIKMMRQDMEAMESLHGQERKEIIDLMIQTLEEQVKSSSEK